MSRARPLFPASSGLPGAMKLAFETLWKAYPPRRPNPRAKAEARFAAECRHARPWDIAEAASAFASECRLLKIDPPFVTHLATWLSERRYLDYPPFASIAAPLPAGQAEPTHAWWPVFRGRVSTAEFRGWIEPLAVLSHTVGETALVEAPSKFRADHVRTTWGSLVARALGVKRVDFIWPEARQE